MSDVLEEKVAPLLIDARGARFSAVLTTIVLSIALVTFNPWVVLAQGAVFAIGAVRGPQFTPYAFIFRKLIKARLKGGAVLEDIRPPQFAQSVGLFFVLLAFAASITSIASVFTVALSLAIAAAFLNAAFNVCIGCELYLLLLRVR